MKLLHYANIIDQGISFEVEEFCFDLMEDITPIFEKEYGVFAHAGMHVPMVILNQLEILLEVISLDIKDKTIVDLGCGLSDSNMDDNFTSSLNGTYQPWLSRILHHLGAKVIGVDYGDLSKEKFKTLSVDLMKPNSLNYLKDKPIELIHSHRLFNSPTANILYGIKPESFQQQVIHELEKIVQPNTPYLFN